MKNNLFIVIEGVDGSGKTTVGKLLADKLGGVFYQTPSRFWRKYKAVVEDKNVLLRFLYYFFATVFSSFEIRLLLKKQVVVCDRYIYSTWVHHIVYGLNILKFFPVKFIPIIKPEIVIYLYANDRIRLKRLNSRKNNTKKDFDFQSSKKAHNSFMRFNEFIKIDTSYLPPKCVAKKIISKL